MLRLHCTPLKRTHPDSAARCKPLNTTPATTTASLQFRHSLRPQESSCLILSKTTRTEVEFFPEFFHLFLFLYPRTPVNCLKLKLQTKIFSKCSDIFPRGFCSELYYSKRMLTTLGHITLYFEGQPTSLPQYKFHIVLFMSQLAGWT